MIHKFVIERPLRYVKLLDIMTGRYVYFRKTENNGRKIGKWIMATCNYCGTNLLVDKECTGDYYPVHNSIMLMSFCPGCGRMAPLIDGNDMLSSRKKRKMAIKIAKHYELGFSETINIATNNDVSNHLEFFKHMSEKMNIPLKEIKLILE